jgi:transcriptional regulator with XRE-family HTH domain
VAGNVRTARRSAGLTQRQLAEAVGVDAITISRWERGVTTPSLPRLRRVAEITETTISDLVRAPNAASADALEFAAIKEELAETRELLDRIARAVDRLAQSREGAGSLTASRE